MPSDRSRHLAPSPRRCRSPCPRVPVSPRQPLLPLLLVSPSAVALAPHSSVITHHSSLSPRGGMVTHSLYIGGGECCLLYGVTARASRLSQDRPRGQVGVFDVSNKRLSSSREPKRQLGTAASKNHTCVLSFASVPADARRNLDRAIRSALAEGTGLSQLHRQLGLRQRYGISVGAIRRYARQLPAAGSLPADGSEVRTLTKRSLTCMPATQRFQDTPLCHLFDAPQRQRVANPQQDERPYEAREALPGRNSTITEGRKHD